MGLITTARRYGLTRNAGTGRRHPSWTAPGGLGWVQLRPDGLFDWAKRWVDIDPKVTHGTARTFTEAVVMAIGMMTI